MDTITAEDGAVLVFTQYVTMARLLERHLGERGIGTQLLHGGTPVRRREEMAAGFQDGRTPVFPLSLKAAGTGLNLTRADHVIHYDRWWNPAVEEQATDRAYRIGQNRPVQVHRLIAEGTVEDRIARMLASKRDLADAVLGAGDGAEGALTELPDAELAELVELRARGRTNEPRAGERGPGSGREPCTGRLDGGDRGVRDEWDAGAEVAEVTERPAGTASGGRGGGRETAGAGAGGQGGRGFPAFPKSGRRPGRFARSWWGNAWIKAMQDTSLDPQPLKQGRRYAYAGVVGPITVGPGRITAAVHDDRGELLGRLLAEQGIDVTAVCVGNPTRVNISVAEPDGRLTKINALGPELTEKESEALLETLCGQAASLSAEWITCGGSLPPGLPADWYAELIRRARDITTKIALDAAGPALLAALPARPDVVKPNREELADAVGRPLVTLGDVIQAADEVRAMGAGSVLASLGASGMLLVEEEGAWYGTAPVESVLSDVGAGDASLTGFLLAGGRGRAALASALAHGAAAVQRPGSLMPTPRDLVPSTVSTYPVRAAVPVAAGR